ncbi:hypothetical protein CRYUN_Cryun21dG0079900 [Craigia yunnanensis]
MSKFSIFLLHFLFTISSSSTIIPLGSTLHASDRNQSWSSPNSTFSLSFIPVTSFSFVAAITYFVGDVTVWSAGDCSNGTAAVVDSGGTLQLLPTGALRLTNGSGTILWDAATANRGVSHASLDDLGNFQLLNNDSFPIWSSFENPTDTLVPSQNFIVGKILRSGSYSLSLQRSGNLTLNWNNTVEYWSLGFNSSINRNLTSPRIILQSNGILVGLDPSFPSGMIMAYSADYGEGNDVFRILRTDSDGNLRIYSTTRESQNITPTWAAVTDQCQNFELIDVNDSRKGCKRKVEIEDCHGNVTIASTLVADGSGFCYMKTPDFVSGYQSAVLPSTSFVKVCGQVVPNPSPYQETSGNDNNSRLHALIIVIVILATVLVLVALMVGFWCCSYRNSKKFGHMSAQYALVDYASDAPMKFSYKELRQSTKGFSERLGEGGFGVVYRGTVANRMVVAVKQLEGVEQGEKQFRMEVATISSTPFEFDIKRENILLDEIYTPKVSDFGLAKLLNPKDQRYLSLASIRGTIEYLAPEWLANLPITSKCDVYSYGMVLLEIEFEKGNVEGIVDKRLEEVDTEQVVRAILVSFWCIQEQPSQRPMMGKVVQMLEGVIDIKKPPAPKVVSEGSTSGTSINLNSNFSALSTYAASTNARSSSSSFLTIGVLPPRSERDMGRESSSLLGLE